MKALVFSRAPLLRWRRALRPGRACLRPSDMDRTAAASRKYNRPRAPGGPDDAYPKEVHCAAFARSHSVIYRQVATRHIG